MPVPTASVIYHVSPPTVAMICSEGAWTDDDRYKFGGYFASQLENGQYVKLAGDMMVSAAGTDETPIGKLISDPQGAHVANGRQATVLLFGTQVLEVEMWTASPSVAVGGSVKFKQAGGVFGEGVWVSSTANSTRVLKSYTTGSAAGTTIPVLFGVGSF